MSGTFVFGYGSLVDVENLRAYLQKVGGQLRFWSDASLAGFTRIWNVSMDNSRDIPGYKYYVYPDSGMRPDVFVTFLNITSSPDNTVEGIIFEVSERLLATIDEREKNYLRLDVSASISPPAKGTIWAYIATDEGLKRYKTALQFGRAVIQRAYKEGIEAAFRQRGLSAYERYCRSTVPPDVPVVDLTRVDIPPLLVGRV